MCDGLFNDTTHNPVRLIYRSNKIDRTEQKLFEYIVPPPLPPSPPPPPPNKVGRNNND